MRFCGIRSNQRLALLALLLLAWSAILAAAGSVDADDEDEFVRQVLEEDEHQHDQHHHYYDDENYEQAEQEQEQQQQQREKEEEAKRLEQEARAARERAEAVASERERLFEAEMQRMDEEQQKAALSQKKRDGKTVRSVLRSSERNNLYGVLGIRNVSLQLPAREVSLGSGLFRFTIPGLTLLRGPSEKDIRRQFRKRALEVHPDKNRDGRAEEAFVAVEEAATILSDPRLRKEYDSERKLQRAERVEGYRKLVRTTVAYVWAITRRTIQVMQTLLGPFFVPVVIVAA
eukprot:CAMPEP_0172384104 /NCGR_PEP_ID=MMETSP1061-20121228/1898_1 /TAXON_ID=37318 /ORGANISM="Pseudo-nitzschia pungens, Strain cf. pungens" /LENGTH=287 /DNA_ID=CAMNT_0013112609 /DNA_START=127 /DNA_END=987 /DNA_ORIENTATION=+